MITDHVPAVRVPPDHTASSRPAVVRARGNVEERRDLDPAPSVLRRNQPCRPKLTWADRALFATLLSVIPNARRQGLRLLVTPDTILRWHRDLVRRRWAARPMRGRTGRPSTRRTIKVMVLRLGRENPGWWYRGRQSELAGMGVKIAGSEAGEIVKNAGIDPAPRRSGP